MKKTIVAFVAALALAIGGTSFVPAGAQPLATAGITPEFPDGTSCAGASDTVGWPAQPVPGLTGYEVDVYGAVTDTPALYSSFQVGPDLTSTAFTIPTDVGSRTSGLNYVQISTVVGGVVSPGPFAISGDFAVTQVPSPISFDSGYSSVGDGTLTVAFYTPRGGTAWGGVPTITGSPGGLAATSYGSGPGEPEPPYYYPQTATLSGLTNGAAYTFTETVTNDCGTATSTSPPLEPADLVVVPPQQTFAPVGQPYSQEFSVSGVPSPGPVPIGDFFLPVSGVAYPGSTLPAGLTGMSYDPDTGVLMGMPTTPGIFSISVCGYAAEQLEPGFVNFNGSGAIGCVPFTLTVGDAPSITSTCPATALTGTGYSCSIDTSGFPDPSFIESDALPSGITFTDNGNGTATLSGTPAPGTGGIYPVSITASNGFSPDATQGFAVTVDQPSAFTVDSPPLTVLAGQPYAYTFVASGFPDPNYSLGAGAPSWLSINPTTGAVSGTVPTNISSFTYSVTAGNSVGSPAAAGPFTVSVSPVVSLSFTGSLTYTTTGPVTSGSLKVSPSAGTLTSVTGTFTIPGLNGGPARVSVAIVRLFGLYIGVVSVSDPGAHLGTTATVFTKAVAATGNGEVTGTASGFSGRGLYTLVFTI